MYSMLKSFTKTTTKLCNSIFQSQKCQKYDYQVEIHGKFRSYNASVGSNHELKMLQFNSLQSCN